MAEVMDALRRLWLRVNEPRVVSVLRFLMYVVLFVGGVSAVTNPPTTMESALGQGAVVGLGMLLSFGCLLGAVSALPGMWFIERLGLVAISSALAIYGGVVFQLHLFSLGNRMLHLTIIIALILSQAIRWVRIKDRPYDPALRTIPDND